MCFLNPNFHRIISVFLAIWLAGIMFLPAWGEEEAPKNPELDTHLKFLERIHNNLIEKIEPLNDEQINWRAVDEDGQGYLNSIGMLAHHMIDTERNLIGNLIADKGLPYNQQAAFQIKDAKGDELVKKIKKTLTFTQTILDDLTDQELNTPGAQSNSPWPSKRAIMLQNLSHLNLHYGEIIVLLNLQGIE